MADSIIFSCDMCGRKSEEEPATLPRRDRCSVELVFRGQRFVLAPPALLPVAGDPLPAAWSEIGLSLPPGVAAPLPSPWGPTWPPIGASPVPVDTAVVAAPLAPMSDEDERVSYALCDACMKRTCAFFDLKVETFDEYSERVTREAALARRATIRAADGGGMQGKMVDQYPTRERTPEHGPGPGGLVDQYPTPGARGGAASTAPTSVHTSEAEGEKKPEPEPPAAEAE